MRSISEILSKAMTKGNICQRRKRDGVIQYLVKTGSEAHWINSDELRDKLEGDIISDIISGIIEVKLFP